MTTQSKSPQEVQTSSQDDNSLAHLERMRQRRQIKDSRRWQLLRIGAWMIAAGLAACFAHVLFYDLQFGYQTLTLDCAAVGLAGGGLLLCVFADRL